MSRSKISLAVAIVLITIGLAALLSNTDTGVQVDQLDLTTKQQIIDIAEKKVEALETEIEEAEGDLKKLEEAERKVKEQEAIIKELQAKKAEEQRLAQAQASNVAVASPETPSAPVGNVEQIVRDAATKHGIDPDYFVRIARCESGLNASAVNYGYNENGHPSGLFQHLSGYWPARAAAHGYAGASVFDAVANANVTASMWASGSHLWECQ